MIDAFGVERGGVSKRMSAFGEPGDKRNTKYAAAAAAGLPLVGPLGSAITGVGYGVYRQTDRSRKARRASIKRAKAKVSKGVFHEKNDFRGKNRVGYVGNKGERIRAVKDAGRASAFVSPRGFQRKKNWGTYGANTGAGLGAGAAVGAGIGALHSGRRGAVNGALLGGAVGAIGGASNSHVITSTRGTNYAFKRAVARGDMRKPGEGERISIFGTVKRRKKS